MIMHVHLKNLSFDPSKLTIDHPNLFAQDSIWNLSTNYLRGNCLTAIQKRKEKKFAVNDCKFPVLSFDFVIDWRGRMTYTN